MEGERRVPLVRLVGSAPAGLDSNVCAVLASSNANEDDGSDRENENSCPGCDACDGCSTELHRIVRVILGGWIDDFNDRAGKHRVAKA